MGPFSPLLLLLPAPFSPALPHPPLAPSFPHSRQANMRNVIWPRHRRKRKRQEQQLT